MKSIFFKVALVLLLVITFSCKKDKNKPTPTPIQACKPTELWGKVLEYSENGDTIIGYHDKEYEWDAYKIEYGIKGRITKIYSTSKSERSAIFMYEGDGSPNFIMQDDIDSKYSNNYFFNEKGDLEKIKYLKSSNLSEVLNFTYKDGNIHKISRTIETLKDNIVTKILEFESYDDKINPIYADPTLRTLGFYLEQSQHEMFYFSKNNPIVFGMDHGTDGTKFTATYEYNDKGLPIKASTKNDVWNVDGEREPRYEELIYKYNCGK